jgi:hypothetical protein
VIKAARWTWKNILKTVKFAGAAAVAVGCLDAWHRQFATSQWWGFWVGCSEPARIEMLHLLLLKMMDMYQKPLVVWWKTMPLLGTRHLVVVLGLGYDDDEPVNECGGDNTGKPLVEENAPNKKPEFEYKHVIGCIELPKNCPCTDEQSLPLLLTVSNRPRTCNWLSFI